MEERFVQTSNKMGIEVTLNTELAANIWVRNLETRVEEHERTTNPNVKSKKKHRVHMKYTYQLPLVVNPKTT